MNQTVKNLLQGLVSHTGEKIGDYAKKSVIDNVLPYVGNKAIDFSRYVTGKGLNTEKILDKFLDKAHDLSAGIKNYDVKPLTNKLGEKTANYIDRKIRGPVINTTGKNPIQVGEYSQPPKTNVREDDGVFRTISQRMPSSLFLPSFARFMSTPSSSDNDFYNYVDETIPLPETPSVRGKENRRATKPKAMTKRKKAAKKASKMNKGPPIHSRAIQSQSIVKTEPQSGTPSRISNNPLTDFKMPLPDADFLFSDKNKAKSHLYKSKKATKKKNKNTIVI